MLQLLENTRKKLHLKLRERGKKWRLLLLLSKKILYNCCTALPIYQSAVLFCFHKSEFVIKHIILCIYLGGIWFEDWSVSQSHTSPLGWLLTLTPPQPTSAHRCQTATAGFTSKERSVALGRGIGVFWWSAVRRKLWCTPGKKRVHL